MIAILVVTKDKRQIKKTPITKDVFIIGRSSQCDLALVDEEMASRQHDEITRKGDEYWARDKGSRNGTLLNGEPLVDRQKLKDGDELEIGSTRIKFILDRNPSEGDEPQSGATRVMDLGNKGEPIGRRVTGKSASQDWSVKVSVVEGPFAGGEAANWDQSLQIGRGLDNHIVLLDDATSIHHARISCDGERHILEDLGSSNGTFVDGMKVKRVELENNQRIKIGLSTLLFRKINLRKQRQVRNRVIIATVGVAVLLVALKLLQPADVAGKFVAEAEALYRRGELTKALEGYQSALKVDAGHLQAKAGVKAVKIELAAKETLIEAELAAGKENYEKAKELCYQVLRNSPNNPQARGLEAVIKSIENAKVAFTSKNWSDAVALLEKARDAFPKSALVRERLAEAMKELAAEQNMTKAKDCLQHQQFDMAEGFLHAVPDSSVYYLEARESLDNIAMNRKVSSFVTGAKVKYQKGQITEALTEIDQGLQVAPSNMLLLISRDRARLMEPLVSALVSAEAQKISDDVALLTRHLQACEGILQAESDPLNELRKRAVTAKLRLSQQLVELSRAHVAKAEACVAAGSNREALLAYKQARQADSNNVAAVQGMEQIRKKMTAAARSAYQRGIVHEELGQADLARESYKAAMEQSAPDEEYYVRASKKLRDHVQ